MRHNQKYLTQQQIESIDELGQTLTIERLANAFEMSKPTLLRIFKENPEIALRYKKSKSKVSNNIAKSLIQKAINGDTTAMMFYLKTRDRWRQNAVKIKIDPENSIKDILNTIITKMSGDGDEVELDNNTLNTLNTLIRTKFDIDDFEDLKKRIEKLENN